MILGGISTFLRQTASVQFEPLNPFSVGWGGYPKYPPKGKCPEMGSRKSLELHIQILIFVNNVSNRKCQ